MKKQFLLLFLTSFLSVYVINAQYNYSTIPDSMKKNADYIVWEDYQEFRVINPGRAVEHVKFAVLITDQYARRYETVQIGYDKDTKINSFSAEIYDAFGKKVKRLKDEDIDDVSAVSGGSLFEDNRRKILHFSHHTYPYTIVYKYIRTRKGLLGYPFWGFQNGFNTSVLSSTLKIVIPNNMKLKYKEYNLKNMVNKSKDKNNIIYTWSESNLIAKEFKELLPSIIEYLPLVNTSPYNFEMDSYLGYMDTWEGFGKWNYELNKGRDILSVESYKKIKELTKNAKSDHEKAKILYEYMQNRTRYVSVQLGIGGWQTFPAEYVDENGFGDCKALSNYMYTMLKLIGIKSHYVLVSAGANQSDIITDFPSNQFNHAILCIPQEKDTIWLECTSQQQPFGYLGSFTDDRHVLLVDENGGKLVKTPAYGKNVNVQIRSAKIRIDGNGNALVNIKTDFKGLKYESREYEIEKSVKDQKKFLHRVYDLSGMKLKSFKYDVDKSEIPSITENVEMEIPKLASTSSKRMFLKINLFSQLNHVPEKNADRKIPFEIRRAFTEIDSIRIKIPATYEVESLPSEKKYITKFGGYTTKVKVNGENIIYIRKLYVEKGIFPASDYQDFYNIRKKIKKADKAKLVLVKNVK